MPDNSWSELESQARWRLEHADQGGETGPPRGMALHLRLWWYRRSGAHRSWSVMVPARDYRSARAVIREIVWDRVADLKAQGAPHQTLKRRPSLRPSLGSRDAELSWQELAPHLESVAGLNPSVLEVAPGESRSEDAFGLVGYRSLSHVRIEWWGAGPRGWRSTLGQITKVRRMLAEAMRDRETREREA